MPRAPSTTTVPALVDDESDEERPASREAVEPPVDRRSCSVPGIDDVDAITAEPLEKGRVVCLHSPDGSSRLFYNISTLIRIAKMKGRWLQPPHFREPMSADLRRRIEAIEGPDIDISIDRSSSRFTAENGLVLEDEIVALGFDVATHFILDRRQIYVCPLCFQHAQARLEQQTADVVETARLAAEAAKGTADEEVMALALRSAESEAEQVSWRRCPLEVLTSLDENTELPYVAYASAALFNVHFRNIHGEVPGTASDYSLRSMVNEYLAQHNERYFADRRFHRSQDHTSRYWLSDLRFNTMRYNRIRAQIEHPPSDLKTRAPFPNTASLENSDDDNFFASDDDEDDDEALVLPPPPPDDDEEEEDDSTNTMSPSVSQPTPHGGQPSTKKTKSPIRSYDAVLRRLERLDKAEKTLKRCRREGDDPTTASSSSSPTSSDSSSSYTAVHVEEEEGRQEIASDRSQHHRSAEHPTPRRISQRTSNTKPALNALSNFEKWKQFQLEQNERDSIGVVVHQEGAATRSTGLVQTVLDSSFFQSQPSRRGIAAAPQRDAGASGADALDEGTLYSALRRETEKKEALQSALRREERNKSRLLVSSTQQPKELVCPRPPSPPPRGPSMTAAPPKVLLDEEETSGGDPTPAPVTRQAPPILPAVLLDD